MVKGEEIDDRWQSGRVVKGEPTARPAVALALHPLAASHSRSHLRHVPTMGLSAEELGERMEGCGGCQCGDVARVDLLLLGERAGTEAADQPPGSCRHCTTSTP